MTFQTASEVFSSPLQPNRLVVPFAQLLIEVLRRPLKSALYTSIAFTERLTAAGAVPSVGTVGDALDNDLAGSQIGLFNTVLIRRRGLWKSVNDVELATLE